MSDHLSEMVGRGGATGGDAYGHANVGRAGGDATLGGIAKLGRALAGNRAQAGDHAEPGRIPA